MWLSRFLHSWWRRASAASKTDAILAILALVAKVYTVGFTIWMAGAKFSAWGAPDARPFWLFVVALTFATALPHLPKRKSAKWVTEDLRRTKTVAVAISEIASAIWNGRLRPEEKHALFMRLLSAIKSEIEGITGDHEGIYSNVSLLIDDKDGHLSVVCRANQDRPLASYQKGNLVVSKALETREIVYEPDCRFADKPYRAIMGIPLISGPEGNNTSGVVSIDSSQAHCFDELGDEVQTKTLTYIGLLKLVIVVDEVLKSVKGRKNVR